MDASSNQSHISSMGAVANPRYAADAACSLPLASVFQIRIPAWLHPLGFGRHLRTVIALTVMSPAYPVCEHQPYGMVSAEICPFPDRRASTLAVIWGRSMRGGLLPERVAEDK